MFYNYLHASPLPHCHQFLHCHPPPPTVTIPPNIRRAADRKVLTDRIPVPLDHQGGGDHSTTREWITQKKKSNSTNVELYIDAINDGKMLIDDLSTGDIKGVLCFFVNANLTLNISNADLIFTSFCTSNQTLSDFITSQLLLQIKDPTTILTTIKNFSTQIKKVQNNTALWNFLLNIPEYFRNPESLSSNIDLNLNISSDILGTFNIQSCLKYIFRIEKQGTFNRTNVTCENPISFQQLLQSANLLFTNMSSDPANFLRVIQTTWVILKQNQVGEMVLENLQQEIATKYPQDLQKVFTGLVKVLLNTTDFLITDASSLNSQFLNTSLAELQTLLEELNLNLTSEGLQGDFTSATQVFSVFLQSIAQEIQYLNTQIGFLSPYNVSNQDLAELQFLIQNWISTYSGSANLSDTTFIKVWALFNQPQFSQILQTFLNLTYSNSTVSNSLITDAFNIINQIIHLSNGSDLTEAYLKQIMHFLISDFTLMNNILNLNSYFSSSSLMDFLQSDSITNFVLDFFSPSNLQNLGSNATSITSSLFKLLSSLISSKDQEIFQNVENATVSLLESVIICQQEISNCTQSILGFEQVMVKFMLFFTSQSNSTVQEELTKGLLQFQNFSSAEKSVINKMLSLLVYFQEPSNYTPISTSDISMQILDAVSLIANMTLTSDQSVLTNLTQIEEIIQIFNSTLEVLRSVELANVMTSSECYSGETDPLQCTLKLISGVLDLLQFLPLTQPQNNAIFVATSIAKTMLGELEGVSNIYQQLSYVYGSTQLALQNIQNNSTLLEIKNILTSTVQVLEQIQLILNSTNQESGKIIGNLLELLQSTNLNSTIPFLILNQTSQELNNMKTQLQIVKWYIIYVKNSTENLSNSVNLYPFVTLTELILNNFISSNPSLLSVTNEIQYVVNVLEQFHIVPSLQTLANGILKNDTQNLEQFLNNIVSVLQIILQKESVNGTNGPPGSTFFIEAVQNYTNFIFHLLQTYDNESLDDSSSALSYIEKNIQALQSVVNDSNLLAIFNNETFQSIFILSKEIMLLVNNAENVGHVSDESIANIYKMLQQLWKTSSFLNSTSFEGELKNILHLSMECLLNTTTSGINWNCSATEIINAVQVLLNDSGCQFSLALPESMALSSILESGIISAIHESITGCNIEDNSVKEELVCLPESLGLVITFISRMNSIFGFNITWVQEIETSFALFSEEFEGNNITCTALDRHILDIINEISETEAKSLKYLISTIYNQSLNGQNLLQYSDYWNEIIQLYLSTQGQTLSNDTVFNIFNYTIFQLINIPQDSTKPWLIVSAVLETLSNLSTSLGTSEQKKDFILILNSVNTLGGLTKRVLNFISLLPNDYLSNALNGNISAFLNPIVQWVSAQNATDMEGCESSLQSLLMSFEHMNLTVLEIDNGLVANMSTLACNFIFNNDLKTDWMEYLKIITAVIISKESAAYPNASMYLEMAQKTIDSIKKFVSVTSVENFASFIRSLTEVFKEPNSTNNWAAYQAVHDFITSLQSLINETLNTGTNESIKVENLTIQAFGTVSTFLNGLNITAYNEIFSLASEIVKISFNSNDTSSVANNLVQRILNQILTYLQQNGLEQYLIQTLQSHISSLNFENPDVLKILQNFLNIVSKHINGTASEAEISDINMIVNTINAIAYKVNQTTFQGLLSENSQNITEYIAALVTAVENVLQQSNISLGWMPSQNETSQIFSDLETLINSWITKQDIDIDLFFNNSTTLVKILYNLYAMDDKGLLYKILNSTNNIVNVSFVLDVLEHFYDFTHLNSTNNPSAAKELYLKQLINFISGSQLSKLLSELNFLFNMTQNATFLPANDFKDVALELLQLINSSSYLYNISDQSNLIAALFNNLAVYIPQKDQESFKNITSAFITVFEILQKNSQDADTYIKGVSVFQNLIVDVVHTITSMEMYGLEESFSNSSRLQFEMLEDSEISLINNLFLVIWNMQQNSYNFSGSFTDVYEQVLFVSELIMNITENVNVTHSDTGSDMELVKNSLQPMKIILQVLATSNMTESLLQIIGIQQNSFCLNQTEDGHFLCAFNLTYQLFNLLQNLQLPDPLPEKIAEMSSLADYWMTELNITDDGYQQIASFYELTKSFLQNEPALQTLFTTLANISQTLQDKGNYNFTISSSIEQSIMIISKLLQSYGNINSSNITFNINIDQLEKAQAQLDIVQWYVTFIGNQTGSSITSENEIYAMHKLTEIILSNMLPTIKTWLTFWKNPHDIVEILTTVSQSTKEVDAMLQLLTSVFTVNQTGPLNKMKIWAELIELVSNMKTQLNLNTSVMPELTTIWDIVDGILAGKWNMTYIDDLANVLQSALLSQNISKEQDLLNVYEVIISVLNLTHSSGNMNFSQLLQFNLESFSTMDCLGMFETLTAIFQLTQNYTPSMLTPYFNLILNSSIEVCDILQWNNSQDDWNKLLQISRHIINVVSQFASESENKYLIVAENMISLATELIAEPSQNTIVTIMKIVPTISELLGNTANITGWTENANLQNVLYMLLDLAWSFSSPKDVILLKVENLILEAIQPLQDMLTAENDTLCNKMLIFSLEAVKQYINRIQNTSLENNFYIPFMKQMWQLFEESGLKDLIDYKFNQPTLENNSMTSSYPTIEGRALQILFNVTDLIISETSLSPPYITTNTTMKILQTVLEDVLIAFLPQSENIRNTLEDSLQTVLNVTRMLLDVLSQNNISQLDMVVSTLTNMTFGTNLSNDTAELIQLFSIINQTGLIPQIANTIETIFTSDNVEVGKLFLNALNMFNKFNQLNDTSTIQELSSIFNTYLPNSLEAGNEAQMSFNTILNLLVYLNRLSENQPADIANTITDILPFFLSPELQNRTNDVVNQTSDLLSLISNYMPLTEQDIFQQIANTTLLIIESVQLCRSTPENCTGIVEGFQNFMLDVAQLQTVIQNEGLGGQFANLSLTQFETYGSLQKTLINDLFLLLSFAQGNNSSEIMSGIYKEALGVINLIFNRTKDELDIITPTALQNVMEVLKSTNITEFLLQIDNLLNATLCITKADADPLLCSLDLTNQLTQLFQLLPLTQSMHDTLSIISSLAEQLIGTINVNLPIYQQLIYLQNVTIYTFQYQPVLHNINTSVVNIIRILQEAGISLNFNMSGSESAINLLSELLQASDFDASRYNLSFVSTHNISELLEKIRLQLNVVHGLLLQVKNHTQSMGTTPGSYAMDTITQWILNNFKQIGQLIENSQSVIESFNNSLTLSDLIQSLNEIRQKEQMQLLIQQFGSAFQNISNSAFISNSFLNETLATSKWAPILEFLVKVTNKSISEISLSPPYITTNATIKLLLNVLEDILITLQPQSENITNALEESLQTVINVTRVLVDIFSQNKINMLVSSLTSMTFGTNLSNDTAKLLQLFSIINQTGLIPQIANTIQTLFTSDNVELGKLFINALDMFNKLNQLNDTSTIQELSSIFNTYLPVSLESGNQTQMSLNTILNLLVYFNRLSEQQPADIANTIINILPFFLSTELQNLTKDVVNQTSDLLGLILKYMPPTEQDIFQQIANTTLLIIESAQLCRSMPENCTGIVEGFQNFMLDVAQLQTVIENNGFGGQSANISFTQFETYGSLQKIQINNLFLLLSYTQSNVSSENVLGVYEEALGVINLILNSTTDELNTITPTSLQSIMEVLKSTNITEFLLQIDNLLNATLCITKADADPLLCSLDLTSQLTQLFQLLPLTQSMHDTISIISTVAEQWLGAINVTLPTYQQLIHLYNTTIVTFQYQPILQAINSSIINIIQLLQEDRVVVSDANMNVTDTVVNLLSEILQTTGFDPTMYNLMDEYTYNISDLLDNIRLQLDVVQWLLLQNITQTAGMDSTQGYYTMHAITIWITNNYQTIDNIIKNFISTVGSLNNTFSLTDLVHLFNSTVQNKQLQLFIQEVELALQTSSEFTLFENLLNNENIQKDAELALQIMQEINQINPVNIYASINKVIPILQGLKEIELGYLYQFHNNATVAKVFSIVQEGMSILYNIQVNGSVDKDMVFRIYNFTYLLVQDELNWIPFQNISAMEVELLDVWYLAMRPFLGGNGSQEYIGNCTAEDVLNILVQTIFKNATGIESMGEANCLWQFVYNSSDTSIRSNQTLNEIIYLALQSSPIFHNICSEDSLHPLAEEMACLLQLMELSVGILAGLNNASGLHIPIIQSLNESLSFICEDMPEHNSTFQPQIYLVKLLDQLFLNQSSPIHFFIQFLVDNSEINIQTSDFQLNWGNITKTLNVLALINGQVDSRIYDLIELIVNVTHLPYFIESWDILDSFLSMNWTVVEVSNSVSILEKLRRAIVLINSGVDAKSIQIYQAVVSLLKTPGFLGSPPAIECETALGAIFRFSDSIWVAFDSNHSSLQEELLSNISSLACNLQNTQRSTYMDDLAKITNILPYLVNYLPDVAPNYFSATEKIISFLGIAFSEDSQETILMSAFELLIAELRLFNTTFIADSLEAIPLRTIYYLINNITTNFAGNITTQQMAIAEDVFIVLSEVLNASSSYTQAISSVSKLVALLPSSFLTISNASQNLLTLTEEIMFIVQNDEALQTPNNTILTCVKNLTQTFSNSTSGNLDEVMQTIQDLFTQSNVSANTSMIPELLKLKINQLQNLTTLMCGFSGSQSCLLACQYNTLLQYTLNLVETEIQSVATAASTVSSLNITTVLARVGEILQTVLTSVFSSLISIPEIPNFNLTAITETFNITSTNTSTTNQATLGNLFDNSSQVVDQLTQVVNLSKTSAEALMNVEIPENVTEVFSWITTLQECHSNSSIVDETLHKFCDLAPDKKYQMAIIFLQHVDVFKLFYRLLVPTSMQTQLDQLLNLLDNLIKQIDTYMMNIPSEQEMTQLLSILNILYPDTNTNTTTSAKTASSRSENDIFLMTRSTQTSSFQSISKYLCNKNYQYLTLALNSLIPTVVKTKQATAKDITSTYGIPGGNNFCSELFSNLVNSTSGAAYWIFLKPMLYGQILYTPDTELTKTIMNKTKNILLEVQGYKENITSYYNQIQELVNNWPLLSKVQPLIETLQTMINNSFVSAILQEILNINSTELSSKLNATVNFIDFANVNMPRIKIFGNIAGVLSSLLSCVVYDRLQPMNSVNEMLVKAQSLQDTNELFAAVTFDLPSGTGRKKRAASGTSTLPKQIKYSISMRSLLSQDTSSIRDSSWIPGPHNSMNLYSQGFVYLQENIERAIVEMQTNRSLDDVAAQYQPMPYPCYSKDNFLYSMSFSLPIGLMITWVLFIAAFVKKLVHEKELRLHEYMKMMGVNSFSHFFAWLIESLIFLILTVIILVLILKYGKILPNSNGFILFLFFLDYSLTVIAMSYLISVFFHNTNVAALSGSLIYIIAFFPYIAVASRGNSISFAGKSLLSLFSPTALSYGTQYIVYYEQQNIGIQWNNIYESPMINDTFNCGWICWMMLIDSCIYLIVGAYIRTVFPGKYGTSAPWYFPFLPSYWLNSCGLSMVCAKKQSGLRLTNMMSKVESKKNDLDLSPNNEPEPTDLNIGVSLHGLTKTYNSKVAVQDLNLTFYESHITALLGHNGAGKTTTLSMLTGLFSATSGTIYVYGDDIRNKMDHARKNMGVCMQYDVLFDHLTTKEHLLLYGSIKAPQWKKRQLHEEVKRILKDTDLYNHRHKPVKALSGGMRRKLSISIALIGGSKVVILDEPTTGVDPCSRRAIWEVISKNKIDKTIILSTHHLDEAEILSDRIAFLERGGLRCVGSPLFLKEKFGTGYHLTLTKKFSNREDEKSCNTERVTALIQSHIPEANLKEDVGGELVYTLPRFSADISEAYLSLLRALDSSLSDLHIGCYGISDTTIEEVFLKLTDGVPDDEQDDTTSSNAQLVLPVASMDTLMSLETSSSSFDDRDDQALTNSPNISGLPLIFKKCLAIFIKRLHNTRRNWKGVISQVLLPVLFVIAAMGLGSLSSSSASYPELVLSPNLYGTTDQSVPFGLYNKSTEDLVSAMDSPPGIDNYCLNNNIACLNESSLGSWNSTGNQSLTYGTCNCSSGFSVCAVPNAVPPHHRTYSGQMLYNVSKHVLEDYLLATTLEFVQKRYGAWSFGAQSSKSALSSLITQPANMTLTTIWYNNEGPHSLPAFLNSFNNFLLRSNLPKNVSNQYGIFVSNLPLKGSVSQASTTATLVNTLVALSVLAGYSITTASFVTYIVKEHNTGAKRLQHIAGVGEVCYWVIHFLYDMIIYLIPVALSIAMIAAFKLPAFYNDSNLGAVSVLFILFGYATFAWMYLIAGTFKNPGMAFIVYVGINLFIGINTIISSSVVYFLIQQTSTSDVDYLSLNNTYNALTNVFKIFPQFCFGYGLIQLSQQQVIQNQLSLYGYKEKVNVFSMDILGWMLSAMAIQGTFCLLLRLLLNDGIIFSVKSFFKRTCLKKYQLVLKNKDEDDDVKAERERVESGRADEAVLELQGLSKIFYNLKKRMIAVNNMTVAIPPGECFGLLGVNGAGKTTTFKMLTGDISPSKGNIKVRNQSGSLVDVLGFNQDWSSFGYCPQDDALDDLMTGEEHLYYYARIHGIPEKSIKSVCNRLLHKLRLVQYKDRITANYSCGTRRKLSTALALVGRPSILLLDEPSSGMDPKTKRHLWKIISEEVRDRCAVVLTSHSMEECEALCTRLAIMVRGKFQCIGSLQHIKNRFGRGFTVKMHLKDSSVSVETITEFMHSRFPNTYLKDHHFTMVEYHVPVSAGGVASIFDLIETNKANLHIINFSVSQTTLDEVFINFAQSQATPDNSSISSQDSIQVVSA
ncbi:ATP-binding cassette sub-family A member 12 [Pelobates cultripes]|uniref:ATP-binding cassette sub-family A member 12 n=1 Tax=Pelobates cultripes TaxID=61616 RepID=A0AAD1SS82_PELCU|nr:ATP-binding cassette sub-family A member 12 [Pelobates cultripes]CAH2306170.1 ATP-binding cassette sub-family A member 12 [Pelobates cultripes]CAH2306171.1 ATP-binding cassette sub-family A member 12 [Pelobates cultripes]